MALVNEEMMRIPFTAYDIFGYLSAGALLLGALMVSMGHGAALLDQQPAAVILLAMIAAYVIGHAVGHLASVVLEHAVTRRCLGAPESHLLGARRPRVRGFLFPGYYTPLPSTAVARVRQRASAREWGADDRGVFLRASTLVRREVEIGVRLARFLNLYGFCRNCAMALLLGAAALAISGRGWMTGAAFVTALLLYLRFLKFYRLYTLEVLLAATETT